MPRWRTSADETSLVTFEIYEMKTWLLFLVISAAVEFAGAAQTCVPAATARTTVDVHLLGAKGDGSTNDTKAIQSAIDRVAPTGGTVVVPDGTYMIDAVQGIRLASRVTLRMSREARLKAIPNDKTNYSIVRISNVSDANVVGGALIGERERHGGTTGEWGMGVTVSASANIVIEGVTITGMWGDGVYINERSRNIRLCSVTADSNRRQGLSVISVDGLEVVDSEFSNTNGTRPAAGIDFEPNARDSINRVQVRDSRFFNNEGPGIQITGAFSPVTEVAVERNVISSNGGAGVYVYGTAGHRVVGNVIAGNRGPAVLLSKGSKSNKVSQNRITGNGIRDDGENAVSANEHPH
jgi:parallel beta-helix repeat protein